MLNKYIALAKNAVVDVAQNGREGLHRQLAAARKGMVSKARSVAGCEGKKKGSGLRARGLKARGVKARGFDRTRYKMEDGMRIYTKGRGLKARGVRARGGGVRII